MKMAKKTYAIAAVELRKQLEERGWKNQVSYVEPRSTSPDGRVTLFWSKQSVHLDAHDGMRAPSRNFARSLWVDIRTVTIEQLLSEVTRYTACETAK